MRGGDLWELEKERPLKFPGESISSLRWVQWGTGSLGVVDLYVLRSLLQGYATCYTISALR